MARSDYGHVTALLPSARPLPAISPHRELGWAATSRQDAPHSNHCPVSSPLYLLPPPRSAEDWVRGRTLSHQPLSHVGEAWVLVLPASPFDSEEPFQRSTKPASLRVKSFDFQTIAFDVGFKRLFKKPENWTLTGSVQTDSFSLHSGCTNLNSPRGDAADLLGERSSGKRVAWKSRRNNIARFFLCKKYCNTGTMYHLPHPCLEGQAVPAQASLAVKRRLQSCLCSKSSESYSWIHCFLQELNGMKTKGEGPALG